MACRYEEDVWEYSESESGESCSSLHSDDEYAFLPWLDKVGSKGDLLYIEEDFSFQTERNFFTTAHSSKSSKSPTTLSTAEKFKKWMKKRKHKVRKKFLLLKAHRFEDNDDMLCNQLSFTSKDVYLEINASRQTLGRKVTLAGELLGLELGPIEEFSNTYMTDKLKVLGYTSTQDITGIKIGDWLHSINDENVCMSNIDKILRKLELPTKVKLTILSPCSESISKSLSSKQSCFVGSHLGHFDVIEEAKSNLNEIPYGAYFLKMLSDSEEESVVIENVLYKFPNESSSILLLKGMFITLCHIVSDIASPPILSCSVEIQKKTVHVGFLKENNAIFLLAIPSEYASEKEVQYFVINIAKLLRYQYSTLENAFSSGNHKNLIDKFFAMIFMQILVAENTNSKISNPHLFEILPSAHWVPLPIDLKTEIDEILNELESSDFGSSSHGFHENQRIFTILGSSFFYKGYLLCNHLQKNDLLDIYLYLQYNYLLTATKQEGVPEIIIWKEVFPSRLKELNARNSSIEEVSGRYFLLVIAMNHCILSTLLEAGGFSIEAEGHPPPEPFYVEEVQNTLIILHSYGITSAIENVIKSCLPQLSSADVFLAGDTFIQQSSPISLLNINNSMNTSLKNVQYSSSPSSASYDKEPADGESDVESDYSQASNENSPVLSKKSRNSSVISGSTESQGSGEYSNYSSQHVADGSSTSEFMVSDLSFNNSSRLTFGSSIFQYLYIDPVEGIFLAPTDEECYFEDGSINSEILLHFRRCCLNMRSIFARSLRNDEILNSNNKAKFGVNNFLRSVYEHGVLYCYTNKDKSKQKSSIKFWIIGRLFFAPEPREVYVCYHESMQQDIVEIAFKLGFGLGL